MTRPFIFSFLFAAAVVVFLATYAAAHADLDAVADGATDYGDPR